ncbi:MAG: selenide, water dikinase SelD [Cyanobacteriota bacterium]|nr:selenide, water dikinase SelD [Cyanobacteriota bacterium]
MDSGPWRHHLLLAGGGHTHALLLRRWLMRPRGRPPATRIVLVSRHSTLCYSGLVPAVVAGLEPPRACRIDLRRLCALAHVTFVRAVILGLDPIARLLFLDGRPPLAFDRLSLDVGALTPAAPGELAVKPLEPFLNWCQAPPPEPRLRGGGASAVEVALALRARGLRPHLLLRGSTLSLGSPAANRRAEALLQQAAIALHPRDSSLQPADLACTGSQAPPWLAAAGLPVDPASGRVLTEATLEVRHHPGLFAAGDCGLIASAPRPPSGVWAVRAAPLLATNLQRSLQGRPLARWRPQRRALQLLGDGGVAGAPRALAFWGPLALGPSAWLWRWKHHLDHRFMASFAALAPMAPASGAMACRGCAAKVAAAPLRSALARLAALHGDPPPPPAEDAPLVRELKGGLLLLQSVDGFPALVDDPWLNGRLTALHACGDLWASGARVQSVQAVVTLPVAAPAVQEELLLQTLAGVRSVVDPLGAPLLGGHTMEGRDGAGLALTLTVNGLALAARPWAKGPPRPGEVLLLSRPLGSGVLFAAAMAGAPPAEVLDGALDQLGQSQAALVDLLAAHGCRACTDITGFGLLGHLGEMLGWGPSSPPGPGGAPTLQVELDGDAIPVFAGALELLAAGHASTLSPANAEALALLDGPVRLLGRQPPSPALTALLIDPQTCGPLLAALPAERAAGALRDLQAAGFAEAAVIGRVRDAGPSTPSPPRDP